VLSRDETCVRDLVRFDAGMEGRRGTSRVLGPVESFASRVISGASPSLLDFLIDDEAGRHSPAIDAKSNQRTTGLGVHLARVHKRALRRGDILGDGGRMARFAIGMELQHLGLLRECTLPVSVVLHDKVAVYRRVAADEERLAKLLIDAIGESLVVAARVLETVDRCERSWRAELPSKKGSVLDSTIEMSLSEVVVVGDRLRAVTAANKSNVYRALQAMVGIGALSEVTGRRKNQIWVATELVDTVETLMAGGRSAGKSAGR